mgnify:CR=1 FL=1
MDRKWCAGDRYVAELLSMAYYIVQNEKSRKTSLEGVHKIIQLLMCPRVMWCAKSRLPKCSVALLSSDMRCKAMDYRYMSHHDAKHIIACLMDRAVPTLVCGNVYSYMATDTIGLTHVFAGIPDA